MAADQIAADRRPARRGALSKPIRQSVEEYGRGVIGGLLFSLPLLYTMEVWFHGFIAHPLSLLAYVAVTFLLLLGYNRYSGMRRDAARWEIVVDSIEELGLALILTPVILFLLARIDGTMPWREVLGKVVIEAMTVAIGVSVGTAQLGGSQEEGESGMTDGEGDEPVGAWGQMVLAFCGATLFAANVAPTEEIVVIGVESSPLHLLGLVAASLLVGAVTLHYSDFLGAARMASRPSRFHEVETVVLSYGAALVASAMILWFFGRFDGASWSVMLANTVVLGFPAMLGASAGRLLIQ